MLCSNCSEEVRPVVAIDIDGTLGDYHGHFLRFAADWLDMPRHPEGVDYGYVGLDPFSFYCRDYFRIDLATYRQIKLAYRQGGMKRTMPIRENAAQNCQAVREEAELWVTTTRPYLSLDNVVPDTVEWLRRHGIRYDGILFDEDKYRQLAQRIDPERVVAILDDLPEMYDAAAFEFGPGTPILVRGPYNNAVFRQYTCDLDAAIDIALARVREWRQDHEAAA